jgi:hypothetical protein
MLMIPKAMAIDVSEETIQILIRTVLESRKLGTGEEGKLKL